MTALKHILRERIAAEGPISLADYMGTCLLHPEYGVYTARDPLGAAGDFTTAPEISQMFGELIGLSLAQSWMDQGAPGRFTLAELGPGRGTLMSDILRAVRRVPGFLDAAEVVLVEASPTLRARQKEALSGYEVTWADYAEDLPQAPLWLVANEFFDALPVRQFQRSGTAWCERRVGAKGDDLILGLAGAAPVPALAHRLEDTRDGDIVEIAPALPGVMSAIGQRIADHGGAALIVDYGDWRSLGDTVQALEKHARVDLLDRPGQADLTAHVDFEAIAGAVRCAHSRLTTQGVFLERLGITQRAQQLAHHLAGADLETHIAAHRRLTHPEEMGTLFKVLGLMQDGAPPIPGLDI
ncbi:SAM-dependent methyltransferase [Marinovum sp. 2_MG-2023]|uniref:class I SAM-dependent methyltransferase n=1 Tax=unclassified Marinovum TaxID=2647166 RepID=UPI0026E3D6C9|nr:MULTISPECIES: SAM-dependent methyltransferase [unclassified Marinovum]MDO6728427.1 SAM-dependent methyltransferase [Marinovum sp. 2_MG-2023]MDO6778157.1 SAM-dependent methyltransferase [Marinovum sp. 1_MG-2023]